MNYSEALAILAEINNGDEKSTCLSIALTIITKKYVKIPKKAVTLCDTVIVKAQPSDTCHRHGSYDATEPQYSNSKTAQNKYLKIFILRALS